VLNGAAVAQRAASRSTPPNADQSYKQGVTLLQKGDVVRAVAVFRAALRLKPDFAVAAAPRAARVRVWQITSW
jgi:Flp pilus assembly protein TadD